jgi:hypothetical protein
MYAETYHHLATSLSAALLRLHFRLFFLFLFFTFSVFILLLFIVDFIVITFLSVIVSFLFIVILLLVSSFARVSLPPRSSLLPLLALLNRVPIVTISSMHRWNK